MGVPLVAPQVFVDLAVATRVRARNMVATVAFEMFAAAFDPLVDVVGTVRMNFEPGYCSSRRSNRNDNGPTSMYAL